MIGPDRALEIARDTLPRIRKFPRSRMAQVAVLAECATLIADRCKTDQQAADFCRGYQQPGDWIDVPHFRVALDAATTLDIPLKDQISLAGLVRNSITEPIRLGDKLIGWCGRPFASELVLASAAFEDKTLSQQAVLGQRVIAAMTKIESEIWQEILKLPAIERASLAYYAQKNFAFGGQQFERNPRWVQCLLFEEWRATCV